MPTAKQIDFAVKLAGERVLPTTQGWSPRMTEVGEVVDFELEYAPGLIRDLREEHRMPKARAIEFTTRYGRCIVCGRHLKAAKSVEAGIGQVCIKYFA
jgi:hypothetical protein